MKGNKFLLFTLLIIGLMCINSQAADVIGTDGAPNDSGIYAIQHTDDRIMNIATDAGIKFSYEKTTTSDTLTLKESGKTIIVNPVNDDVTFNLPDADVGMSFTFMASDGNVDGTQKFTINPQDTDFLRGVVNGTTTSSFAAGDSAISAGSTGDSISVFCAEDLYWDVVQRTGTFTDDN